MIVQNISGKEIRIPELKKILPATSAYFRLPNAIAFKYKQYLKPIQMSDDMPLDTMSQYTEKSTPQFLAKQPQPSNKAEAMAQEIANLKAAASKNIHDPSTESRESFDMVGGPNTIGFTNVSGAPVSIEKISVPNTFVEESKTDESNTTDLKKDGTPRKKPGRKAKS